MAISGDTDLACGSVCCVLGAIHQFNKGHRCIVANAETHFQNTQVTAVTVRVTRADFSKQLDDDLAVAQAIERETLVGQRIVLGKRDDGLDDTAQLLGLGQRGLDGFVTQQRHSHITQHRQTMRGSAIQFAESVTMTHGISFSEFSIQLFYRRA